jgi:hypothetical protein
VSRLRSAAAATAYQKQWFADLRERVTGGEPLVLVNADAPQEVLRALDIPYVVNQWWASVVASKGKASQSLDVLHREGYPDFSRQYDAIALGSLSLPAETAPWGGLPHPSLVLAERSGDAAGKVFELWEQLEDTPFYALERSSLVEAPSRWWELVPNQWEQAFGTARLDLLQGEIADLVDYLQRHTGRTLRPGSLEAVMALVNEQAEWNRRTRDLLASARPLPVSINDIIPSVMIPQWHRGTEWARDAARSLYEDCAELVSSGAQPEGEQRLRLMWVGRGLWYDLDLYRRVQQSHQAVFVWSMYLAIAADGYVRYGPDPLRALAARFVGLTDQLYTPPWSCEWYVKEARTHAVDAVVHLVAEDVPGSYFVSRALREAGIPVLEIRANNADPRRGGAQYVQNEVAAFLDTLS